MANSDVTVSVPRIMRWCAAVALLVAVMAPADAAAQGRRARLSDDLDQQLRSGSLTDSSVIVSGTQARVDRIAARHGLVVRKRLQSGAVLDVPGDRLAAVAGDEE